LRWAVTVAPVAICVLGGGVLIDRYGTQESMLRIVLLALSVACVMMMPGLLARRSYAGPRRQPGRPACRRAPAWLHFGTRHLGNLKASLPGQDLRRRAGRCLCGGHRALPVLSGP
jgi:hypothetical protein